MGVYYPLFYGERLGILIPLAKSENISSQLISTHFQVMRTFGWNPTESELQVYNYSKYPISFPQLGINFLMKEMISEIDQDGNGEISFNEFVWLMTR